VPAQEISEGETIELTFTVSDPDGDPIYLEAEVVPAGGEFDPVQGTFVWQPNFDLVSSEEGSLTLPPMTVTVDDLCLSDSTLVEVTVQNENLAPFFFSIEAEPLVTLEAHVEPGAEQRLRFRVIDPDNDAALAVTLEDAPEYALLDGHETLVLSPLEADSGEVEEFDVVASDGLDSTHLPIRVVVGTLGVEVPRVEGLSQSDGTEVLDVGAAALEGSFTFSADPHGFNLGGLRLQVDLAPLGVSYGDGLIGIGDATARDMRAVVDIDLAGNANYRWRARFLSDEFGGGPFSYYGENDEASADLVVKIEPETTLHVVPHDPSPIDVTFEFSSPNASDFECKMDEAEWGETGCGPTSKTYLGLSAGNHTFQVRAVSRDGTPDPTPAQHAWEVMAVAEPDTSFSSTPPSGPSCSASPSCGTVSFNFTSNQSPSVTYQCRLSKTHSFDGDWVGCGNPTPSKEYVGLTNGSYTFSVRAINLVDEADSTPASHDFNASCGGCD